MRRENFEVEVRNVDEADGEGRPEIAVEYDGAVGRVAERLVTSDGTLDADEIDVAYRRQTAEDPPGVLAVTDRITGGFVLEANADPDALNALIDAARGGEGDDETGYRLRITDGEGKSTVYDERTLLVYDADGSLRRGDSLIPGGVEL